MPDALISPWEYWTRPEYDAKSQAAYRMLTSADTFDSYWSDNSYQRVRDRIREGAFFVTNYPDAVTVSEDYEPARGVAVGLREEGSDISYRFLDLKGNVGTVDLDQNSGYVPLLHRGSLELPASLSSNLSAPLTVFFTGDHEPPRNMESGVAELVSLAFAGASNFFPWPFSPTHYEYTGTAAGAGVVPIAAVSGQHEHIVVLRNGTIVASGTSITTPVALDDGTNVFELVVTAADRVTQVTYTVTLTRT